MINSNLLRSVIAAHGITQKEVAVAIGVSENTLSAKITGKRAFNTDEILNICDFLNIEDIAMMKDIFLASPSQNRDKEPQAGA